MRILDADHQMLVFERCLQGERLRCSFNLSNEAASFTNSGRRLIDTGQVEDGLIGPFCAIIEEM
jgi:alpha-glucosidase